jgi:Lar family restriction alleviation protein
MTEELKPCPFCGGTDVEAIDQQGVAWVLCKSCSVDGPFGSTAEEATAVWNHRPSPALIGLPIIDESLLGEGK